MELLDILYADFQLDFYDYMYEECLSAWTTTAYGFVMSVRGQLLTKTDELWKNIY